MKYKLKHNQILDGDFKTPDMVLATLSQDLTREAKQRLVSDLNTGAGLLQRALELDASGTPTLPSLQAFLEDVLRILEDRKTDLFRIRRKLPTKYESEQDEVIPDSELVCQWGVPAKDGRPEQVMAEVTPDWYEAYGGPRFCDDDDPEEEDDRIEDGEVMTYLRTVRRRKTPKPESNKK